MFDVEGLRGGFACSGRADGDLDDEAAEADASAATWESRASSEYAWLVTRAISSSCLTSAMLEEGIGSSTANGPTCEEGPG